MVAAVAAGTSQCDCRRYLLQQFHCLLFAINHEHNDTNCILLSGVHNCNGIIPFDDRKRNIKFVID